MTQDLDHTDTDTLCSVLDETRDDDDSTTCQHEEPTIRTQHKILDDKTFTEYVNYSEINITQAAVFDC